MYDRLVETGPHSVSYGLKMGTEPAVVRMQPPESLYVVAIQHTQKMQQQHFSAGHAPHLPKDASSAASDKRQAPVVLRSSHVLTVSPQQHW